MKNFSEVENQLDRWHQNVPVVAFPVGVWLRHREDRAHEYTALLSYYGFFSLFPLLSVLVTLLGFALRDNDELLQQVLDSVFSRVPVLGEVIASEVEGLEASGIAMVFALGFTLWAGIGVVRVAQDAFNNMWGVSVVKWPSFFPKLLRALGSLLIIVTAFIASAGVSTATSYVIDLPGPAWIAGALVAIVTNILAALAVYKVLTVFDVGWRDLLPGAVLGGIALWVLQLIGGLYITSVILGASAIYGTFASVIGLLVWISLVARVLLLGSEVNVVAHKRLWPRSFNGKNLTSADEKSFAEVGNRRIRRLDED